MEFKSYHMDSYTTVRRISDGQSAVVYPIDEPSAYLNYENRINYAKGD